MLIISGAVTFLVNGLDGYNNPFDSSLGILAGVMVFFTVSGVVWGPLYTWMVVVMLIWGRGRSTGDIRRMYLFSPLLLACSMGIPVVIADFRGAGYFLMAGILRMNNMGFAVPILFRNFDQEMSSVIGVAWLFMAAICIVIGYAFVGTVVWVERGLTKRGKFKDEPELPAIPPS